MYRTKAHTTDAKQLDQGDILTAVYRPQPPLLDKHLQRRNKSNMEPATDEHLKAGDANLRFQMPMQRVARSMVLSNSCDNFVGIQILLAPILPFKFGKKVQTDSERWQQISNAATSGLRPGKFYLPGDPTTGMDRSEVCLDEAFFLSDAVLSRFLKTGSERVSGLNDDGLRHLRWSISYFFSRNARDDNEWLTDGDARLKLAWLEEQVAAGHALQEEYRVEAAAIRVRLGIPAQLDGPGQKGA